MTAKRGLFETIRDLEDLSVYGTEEFVKFQHFLNGLKDRVTSCLDCHEVSESEVWGHLKGYALDKSRQIVQIVPPIETLDLAPGTSHNLKLDLGIDYLDACRLLTNVARERFGCRHNGLL